MTVVVAEAEVVVGVGSTWTAAVVDVGSTWTAAVVDVGSTWTAAVVVVVVDSTWTAAVGTGGSSPWTATGSAPPQPATSTMHRIAERHAAQRRVNTRAASIVGFVERPGH
jgi:hypothetical protein